MILEDFAYVFGWEGIFLDLGLSSGVGGGGGVGEAFSVGVAFGLES